MEELRKFIGLLWRNRFAMIIVPLITMIITFYIVRNLPDVYDAPTQIATGIVDETQHIAFADVSGVLQDSRINQKFTNLIETIKSRNLLNQVSYQLILHDLTSPSPFKEYSPLLKEVALSKHDINHLVEVYTKNYQKAEGLDLRDPDQERLARVLASMGYDAESILYNLSVFRIGSSDFIFVDFESDGAELSAFVVNQICKEFIKDYTRLIRQNQVASVTFLQRTMQEKLDTLNHRVRRLSDYKIKNRILDLTEQSSQLLNETATYSAQEQDLERQVASLEGAISSIDRKLDPQERRYAESAMTSSNLEVPRIRNDIQSLYDKYIQSNFDAQYKKSIDSLQDTLRTEINELSGKETISPLSTQRDLIQQKLNLQMQRDLATYGLGSVKRHLTNIGKNYEKLVQHDAVISSLDRDIDIVQQEYQDLLSQFNQVNMESQFPINLRQVQLAMPGAPLPSKKMPLVILSGMASGAIYIMLFFIIFFFDDTIRKPAELALKTRMPVLGYLNLVDKSTLDLKEIWKNLHETPEIMEFKKQLRSTRFEVTRELARSSNLCQTLSITSLSEREGKTLISACIAYTYAMINKKVLLIDGNFDNPSITKNSNTQIFIEDYFETGEIEGLNFNSGIIVMGNHGGDKSLLEICDENLIHTRLNNLKKQFDIILVETPSLNSLNKAKEWILFTDKTLSVFEANQSLNEVKKQHINYFSSINGQFIGWILNKVKSDSKTTEKVAHTTVLE